MGIVAVCKYVKWLYSRFYESDLLSQEPMGVIEKAGLTRIPIPVHFCLSGHGQLNKRQGFLKEPIHILNSDAAPASISWGLKLNITTIACSILTCLALLTQANLVLGQCSPVSNEGANGGTGLSIGISPTCNTQTTTGTNGIGKGSERIYTGFTAGHTYYLALSDGGGTSCRQARFENGGGTALSSYFDIATGITITAPAGATRIRVRTTRSNTTWSTTSSHLSYRRQSASAVLTATASPDGICEGGASTLTVNGAVSNGGQIDYSIWGTGTGSTTGFDQNGSTTENHRINGTDPWGNSTVVWEARPDNVSGPDGGWNTTNFPIDNTKLYRFSVWVNRTVMGADGRFYLGVNGYGSSNGVITLASGANNTNPYFYVSGSPPGAALPQGEWVLVVGHVYPHNHTGTGNHPESGRYTVSGYIGGIDNDFKWLPQTTAARHRTYLYYCTDVNVRQRWVYPRVDVVDGSEPSIQDLLNGFDRTGGLDLGGTWQWFSNSCGSGAAGTGTSISVSPGQTTDYFVRATDACATTPCKNVTVTVNEPPSTPLITASGPTTFCNPGNVTLTAESSLAGNALSFNGSGHHVNLGNPAALNITGDMTIEMWLRPDNFSARRNPYNKAYGGCGTITQELNGTLNFYWGTSGANANPYQGFNSGTALTLNQWNHVALVRDLTNGQLRWYINGVQTNTATPSYAAAVAGSNPVLIGTGYTNGYHGEIDEVRIWNVARTAAQVQNNRNTTVTPGTAGLAGYWRMDEDGGNLIYDSSGNSSTGAFASGTPDRVVSTAPLHPEFNWSPGTGLSTTSGAVVTASPATSQNYLVTASTPEGCSVSAPPTNNLIAWHPLDGNADDMISGNDGEVLGPTEVAGVNASAYQFNVSSDRILIPHTTELSQEVFGTSNNFTISAWARPTSWTNYSTIVNKATGGSWSNTTAGLWSYVSGFRCVMGSNEGGNPAGSSIGVVHQPSLNEWHHIACVADGTNLRMYVDGAEVGSTPISGITRPRSQNTQPITVGRRSPGTNESFPGRIDDIRIYKAGLTAAQIESLYLTATVPVVVEQPSTAPSSINASTNPICVGAQTTLSVVGGSLGTDATWEWYTGSCGGTPVGTGTSIDVSPGSTTTYFVRAEGTCNTTACASLTVTVNTLSTAPTGITGVTTICNGGSTTLTRQGGSLGTGGVWTWYSGSCGGTQVGTGNSVTVSPTSNTTYYVRAEGTCNTTACASQLVTVPAQPSISITAGGNQNVCSGSNAAAFTASISGGSGCTYQWQSSINGTAWTDIGGATSASYTPTGLTNSTFFRCRTASCIATCSEATSQVRFVAVTASPLGVSTHPSPASQTVCVGADVSYTAQANMGSGTTRYRLVLTSAHGSGWHGIQEIRGFNAAGTEQTLSCQGASSVTYSGSMCGASNYSAANAFDGVFNSANTFGVQWLTPQNTSAPNTNWQNYNTYDPFYSPEWIEWSSPQPLSEVWVYNGRYASGTSGTTFKDFYILVSHDNGATWHMARQGAMTNVQGIDGTNNRFDIEPGYTWKRGATTVGTGSGLNLTGVGLSDGGNYTVEMTYGCGTPTVSNTALLNVVEDPAVASQPSGASICAGGSHIISTSISNGTGLGYQWQYWTGSAWANVAAGQPATGFSYANATTASMTINTTAATPFGTGYQFRCVVTSGSGCSPNPLNTNGATVTVIPSVIEAGHRTWTGNGVDSDWSNALNWDCGGVPTLTTDVVIPPSTPSSTYPIIVNGQTANCRTIRLEGLPSTIEIQDGGELRIDSP